MHFVAILVSLALSADHAVQTGRTVTGDSQHIDVQCRADGGLMVTGSHNVVTTDRCSRIVVSGDDNTLNLYARRGATLRVTGSRNRVRYIGVRPRTENLGTRNEIGAGAPGRD